MSAPEMVLNLWYVVEDRNHLVYALAAKPYALYGTDDEKFRVLKQLAATDYWTAKFVPVPQRFCIVAPNGNFPGFTTVSFVNNHLDVLFAEVLESFGKDFLGPIRFTDEGVKWRRLRLSQEPLFILTALMDDGMGDLRPEV